MKNKADKKMQEALGERIARLATEKYQLELKVHLTQADVHDEWDSVEVKWQQLQAASKLLMYSTADVSKNSGKTALRLVKDMKRTFKPIRKTVKAAA